jgi:DNA-binding NarL/FixJ family response regulator
LGRTRKRKVPDGANVLRLTRAEREVALAFCKGLSEKEVANVLHRSYHTVRTEKKAIYRKLGVSKDTELMAAMICEHLGIEFKISQLRTKGVTLYDTAVQHRTGIT